MQQHSSCFYSLQCPQIKWHSQEVCVVPPYSRHQKRDENSLQQEFPRGNPPAFNTNPDTSADSFAEVEISTGVGGDDYACLFLYEQLNDGHLNRELFSRYLAARHVVEKDDDYVWEDAEKQT